MRSTSIWFALGTGVAKEHHKHKNVRGNRFVRCEMMFSRALTGSWSKGRNGRYLYCVRPPELTGAGSRVTERESASDPATLQRD
jgi:hypothetical protein